MFFYKINLVILQKNGFSVIINTIKITGEKNNMKKIGLKILLLTIVSGLMSTAAMAADPAVKDYTLTTETTAAESTTETSTETTTSEPTTFDEPVDKNGNPLTGSALEVYNIVKNTCKTRSLAVTAPEYREEVIYNDADKTVKEKSFRFKNNDIFSMKRYTFNSFKESWYRESIVLPGSGFEMRYIDPITGKWDKSQNPLNAKKQTLFINTDKSAIILSIPAVYTNNKFTNNTIEYNPSLEKPVTITVNSDAETVTIEYSFPNDPNYVGEIWYLLSTEHSLLHWYNINHVNVLCQDLALNSRFSWDGYYFEMPSNYIPNGSATLFRQPANYVGASFTRYGNFPAAFDLGYAFTYICMQNQTEKGYWKTGPESSWLSEDFNIGAGFYDTRFNTEFASNLINAYLRYNNSDFLMSVCQYAEYFINHAAEHHYETKNGGWLVEDYGYDSEHNRTHVSLNHQLAEMNMLYTLYQTTREEKYKEYAEKMLLAIEDTRDQWVLENDNLRYALYYNSGTNLMVDYPYITYNDLFDAQTIHNSIYGKDNDTIAYLMNHKMNWMRRNNVSGYKSK